MRPQVEARSAMASKMTTLSLKISLLTTRYCHSHPRCTPQVPKLINVSQKTPVFEVLPSSACANFHGWGLARLAQVALTNRHTLASNVYFLRPRLPAQSDLGLLRGVCVRACWEAAAALQSRHGQISISCEPPNSTGHFLYISTAH